MRKETVFINEKAPQYIREMLTQLADERVPGNSEHPYLEPGAPRWMYDKLAELERQGYEIREKCMADYQRKAVTWLFQMDGFNITFFPDQQRKEETEYWGSSGYQLANGGWNARLYIAPDTTRTQAITLAQGFVDWLVSMTDENFAQGMTPPGPPQVKAQIIEPHSVQEVHEEWPFF